MANIGTTAALLQPAAKPEKSVQNLRPPNIERFRTEHVDPPAGLYVGINDLLQVTLAGLSAAVVLLEVRILTTDNQIIIEEETITAPNSRTPASKQFRLPEGFILSVSLQPTSAALFRGQLFGNLAIVRSQGPAVVYTYSLASGYIGLLSALYWPNPRTDWPTSSSGLAAGISQVAPAAGADWTYTPAALLRQRVQSIAATLVTSATVATRQVTIQVSQGGFIIAQIPAPSTQIASLTVTYSFVPGLTGIAATGGLVVVPLPPGLIINSGTSISAVTQSIQVGDQWSTIKIGTEDWIDQ